MSRKKKHAEHVNHERWLVSYADFITLLFAFFVVMFAASQVDKRKAGKVALAIQVAFQEMGIFETSNTEMPLSISEPAPFSQVQMVENVGRTNTLGRLVSPTSGVLSNAPGGPSSSIQEQIERRLAPEIERKELSLRFGREGLVLSLGEVGFFASGSARLRPGSEPALAKIAAVLRDRPQRLRIEGHTDNVPIHTPQFASNWELSTARATEIIRLFIEQYGFAPTQLSAAGYAEFFPIAGNDTPEGRAMNRRVDIVVLSPAPLHLPQSNVLPEPPRIVP